MLGLRICLLIYNGDVLFQALIPRTSQYRVNRRPAVCLLSSRAARWLHARVCLLPVGQSHSCTLAFSRVCREVLACVRVAHIRAVDAISQTADTRVIFRFFAREFGQKRNACAAVHRPISTPALGKVM